MTDEHQIVQTVYTAKKDPQKADELIQAYIPFIRSEASKAISRLCTAQDDEYSIAMIAFYEAIMGYERSRGTFLGYAGVLIRNRLIDYHRKESRRKIDRSLHEENDEKTPLMDCLADERDHYEESAQREATRQEIEELCVVMSSFGICFSDVVDNSPKQERTLNACAKAIRCAIENRELLHELLQSRKLPMARLINLSGVERKTLERHRKYLLAMLLIQTNGYEIIRGHLCHIIHKGGATA